MAGQEDDDDVCYIDIYIYMHGHTDAPHNMRLLTHICHR